MPAAADTVDIPKRIQLVTPPGYRSAATSIDEELVNCYAERDPVDGEYWVQKRPCFGSVRLSPVASGLNPARGLYRFVGYFGGSNSYIFLIINNSRLSMANQATSAISLIGNISGNQANYTFETVRTSPNYTAVFNDSGQAYYTDSVTITNMNGLANFPGPAIVRGWAYLDGYLFVMTVDNRIFNSAIDNPASWSALNFIVARNGSDISIALSKHKEYVVALKESSTEFFYNANNSSGSPLLPLRGSKIPFGCTNAYTVQSIDDELFWMFRKDTGAFGIVRLTNLVPKIISTPPVDRILRSFSGFIGGSILTTNSFQLKIGGHRFYGISGLMDLGGFANRRITLVYDLDQNLWYRWTDATNLDLDWPVNAAAGPDSGGRIVVQNYNTGNLYAINEDYVTSVDDDIPPKVEIWTPRHDFGTQREKHLGGMLFRGDKVIGSLLQMQYSDDDSEVWSAWQDIDLSMRRPELYDQGSFTSRSWRFRHERATSFRMKTMDLQIGIGSG